MGSWNKTCGLTNLPIMAGEDTYVFVLQRVNEIDNHCYTTHLYRPLLLPFVSTYNDYGAGENSRGATFPLVMEGIKNNLVEMPLGQNPYHDIAVSKDEWGEDLFFESVHERRLKIKWGGEVDLTFVMFRKDAADSILAKWKLEQYVGENKGNTGYRNSYISYSFEDVRKTIPDAVDRIIADIGDKMPENTFDWERVFFRRSLRDDRPDHSHAASWLFGHPETYRYCNVVRVLEEVAKCLANGDRDTLEEILTEHLRAKFLDSFMMHTRKSWIPGGEEGSQSQDFDAYRTLIAAMNEVMDARDARYAAEDGEDEE